jgi:hypothetical protein
MPSLQESAPGGKAAKFVAANPLGPMADPFAGMVSSSLFLKNRTTLRNISFPHIIHDFFFISLGRR